MGVFSNLAATLTRIAEMQGQSKAIHITLHSSLSISESGRNYVSHIQQGSCNVFHIVTHFRANADPNVIQLGLVLTSLNT